MHTVAEFKRALKPGVVFYCQNLSRPDTSGKRTVVRIQRDGFFYTRPDHDHELYLRFPKKSRVRFSHEGVVFLNSEGQPRFVFVFKSQE